VNWPSWWVRHPSHTKLVAYASGMVERGEARPLIRHLADCAACRGQLEVILQALDQFDTVYAGPPEALGAIVSADWERLLARVRGEPREVAEARARASILQALLGKLALRQSELSADPEQVVTTLLGARAGAALTPADER
jgi:hypothetical protein